MLQEKLKNKNLILGSKSPRRQNLLGGLDIEFSIQTQDVDEYYLEAKAKIQAAMVFGGIGVVIDDEEGLIIPDVARKQVCLLCIVLGNNKHKNKK